MFEYDQHIVESLLAENNNFKRLYNKHVQLKQRVTEAYEDIEVDDFTLEKLKKEKLMLKDKMAAMIEDYRRSRV